MKYKKEIVYYAIIAWCLYHLLERQKGRSTSDVIQYQIQLYTSSDKFKIKFLIRYLKNI